MVRVLDQPPLYRSNTLFSCYVILKGKHVVFGRVIRGYAEVVEKIANVPVDEKDRPNVPVAISNCGELMLRSQVQQKETKGSITYNSPRNC